MAKPVKALKFAARIAMEKRSLPIVTAADSRTPALVFRTT
jgi:hypothetical protein